MKGIGQKSKRLKITLFILSLFSINILVSFLSINNSSSNNYSTGFQNLLGDIPRDSESYQEEYLNQQWLINNGFDTVIAPWFNDTDNAQGDLNATYTASEADFEVLGEQKTFSFVEDPPQSSSWTVAKDPNFPFYPDTYQITAGGCRVAHYWDEGADQSVAVNWKRNFTMPVNMSDYIITSASIQSEVNGEVTTDSYQGYSDGIEAGSDLGDETTQYATGDYTRFYIFISDLYDNNVYEIAYNQTTNLGQDDEPYEVASTPDTYMVPVTEETLKIYLASVLNNDDYNFTMTLGIRIWCEDNYPQDSDEWLNMFISSVNLTFTYEKKIDQQTSVSWNQIGNQIDTEDNPVVTNATVQLKYKVNQTWLATTGSQNSELAVKINNEQHSETIKLRDATGTYQEATFSVTNKILIGVAINITIELLIWDDII